MATGDSTEHQEANFAEKHERARTQEGKWSRRERRRRRFKPETKDQLIARLRVAELERLYNSRYGRCLPDDDAGREDLEIIFHHLARVDPNVGARSMRECGRTEIDSMIEWASRSAPWLPKQQARALATKIERSPRRFRADHLGRLLNLTREERERLGLRTIRPVGMTKGELAKIAKQRRVERKRAKRRAQGVRPRDEYEGQSLTKMKPWEAEGVSRSTWYNRRSKDHAGQDKRQAARNCIMKILVNGSMLSTDLAKAVAEKTGVSKATRRRAWDELRKEGKVEAYRPDPAGKGRWHSRRLDVAEHYYLAKKA